MMKSVFILLLITILSGGFLFSQCPLISELILSDTENGWKESTQSKSFKLFSGDELELSFIAQAGMKYRIQAFTGTSEITKQNIDFQLIIKEVNRLEKDGEVSYSSTELILFDSKYADKDDEAIIVTPFTQRLSVKVKMVGKEVTNLADCAFLLIEAKRIEN